MGEGNSKASRGTLSLFFEESFRRDQTGALGHVLFVILGRLTQHIALAGQSGALRKTIIDSSAT